MTEIGKVGRAAVLVAGLCVLLAGCRSTKKTDEFPKTVEATVEAQAPPEKVDFIEVTPWSAKPGDTVNLRVGGTPGRQGSVNLVGPNNASRSVNLSESQSGVYTGSVTADGNLPPGRYRVEASLAGGPSGQPATLVSNRALVIEQPPPPPPQVDACDELRKLVAEPRIRFAFNRDELNQDATTYLAELAEQIVGQGGRVTRVVVEGHADERGTTNYNLELGARRARRVAAALKQQQGLGQVEISTLSKGEEAPVVPNAQTEEEHAQNRRAVFLLECAPQR